MARRLVQLSDLEIPARNAGYCVARLAKLYHLSTRQFERHFILMYGQPPKKWLLNLRQKTAVELLLDGASIKEAAEALGYGSNTQHFARDFQKAFGYPPSDVVRRISQVTLAKNKQKCVPPAENGKGRLL